MGILARLLSSTPPRRDLMGEVARAVLARRPRTSRITLVKLVHLVQVVRYGRTGQRAFPEWFEATAMGPYNADLSRTARSLIWEMEHGSRWTTLTPSLGAETIAAVDEVCRAFRDASDADVNAAVSRPGGAWHQLWRPDPFMELPISDPLRWKRRRRRADEGPTIGFDEMADEYRLFAQTGSENETEEKARA
jgi:hypothetical protein